MSKLSDKLTPRTVYTIPDNLWARYTESHRKYHDIEHIMYMLMILATLDTGLAKADQEALVWAILYHDAVYNLSDPDKMNEDLSASLFIEDHADYPLAVKVARAIGRTKTHILPQRASKIDKYLVDLDLWALSDEELYHENSLRIQDEVGATDEEWKVGRGAWLENFLKRSQIYYTPQGMLREAQARDILERDFANLK